MKENNNNISLLNNRILKYILVILSIMVVTVLAMICSSTKTKALSLQCDISTESGVSSNLSNGSLPNGTKHFYSDQRAYFNIAGDTDVYINKLNLTIYREGSYYDSTDISINNYIRYHNVPYNNLPAGNYTYEWSFNAATYSPNNGYNSKSSGKISFTVSDSPHITYSSFTRTVKSGDKAEYSVIASGGKSSLSYQWCYSTSMNGNGTVISGANSSSYSFTANSNHNGRYYYCVVSDGERTDSTSRFTLSVTYVISYSGNGGSGAPSNQTKDHGVSLTLSNTVPTRSGYKFLGWSISSSATTATYNPGDTFTTNANTMLYAVWTSVYQLYENSSSSIDMKSTDNIRYFSFTPSTSGKYVIYSTGSDDTKVILYNSNYTELTSDDDGGSGRNFRLEYNLSAGTKYIYGIKFYSSSKEGTINYRFGRVYTISYNANGGSNAPSSQNKDYGIEIKLSSSVPTRSGYKFLGWSTSSSATSATYNPGDTFITNANTMLYAVWTSVHQLYENSSSSIDMKSTDNIRYFSFTPSTSGKYVIYSTGSDDTKVILYNSNYTELTSDDDGGSGRNFRLEYNLSAGTKYIYGIKFYSSSKEGTINYRFGRVYTISYNANGGSNAPSSQNKDYGIEIKLSSSVPTRSGYKFLGWSTSSSATSATYNSGSFISSNANTTLYAVWSSIEPPTCSFTTTNDPTINQTITLKFNSSVGICGYYWGTNSNISSNTFYSTSATNITKTISSSGTYYFAVKDTNGNLSTTKSITFYKTILNANGGSITPSYIITQSNTSVTPPEPTWYGNTFYGWSTSATSSFGSKTITPTGNNTYYAVWVDKIAPTCTISSTNSLARSQTVTLNFWDNKGIAGYYWGKSKNNNYNNFTSTSDLSAIQYVTDEGTYYLTVKDKFGNLSETKSITFSKITLDATGGKVFPEYIITPNKNDINLPRPTRDGYIFNEWIKMTSSSGEYYYASWNKITTQTPKKSQTISAKSFTKYYGDKSFSLGAKAKTKLTYKSSNNSIATVSSNGKVTIKGIGKVTITVTAVGSSSYNTATKKITINVILRPVNKNTIKIKKINKTSLNVSWSKVANVSGYNIKVSITIKGKNFNTELKRNKTYVKMNNAKKGQKVNFLIRTYKKIGKKYYYSSWMRKNIII